MLKQEIDHLSRLTADLFEAAQQETLALTLRLTPTDIKPLLEALVTVTRATARMQQQIELWLETPANLPLLQLDPDRFSQIMRNLLQNALRWTPPGGLIQVQAVVEGSRVRITVQDTGIGIAADALSHIWRRTYRVDQTGTGSGLGLATVKTLVEAMHGTVEVESVLHSGTCFRLFFPLADH